MPDLQWNRDTWDRVYDWHTSGEEWSTPWGTSRAQWFATILPRVGTFLPAGSVLEIGPGFGRFTQFLLPSAGVFFGVDISEKCVRACSERFSGSTHAQFLQNDGQSLQCVAGSSFDLVFSYDTLVHAEYEVIAAYIAQIVSRLSAKGVAFIHHSNLGALPESSNTANRSKSVSAEIFEQLVRLSGGRVLLQETIAWEQDVMSDCYTTFCRADAYRGVETLHLADVHSQKRETASARDRFQHYLKLGSPIPAENGRPAPSGHQY